MRPVMSDNQIEDTLDSLLDQLGMSELGKPMTPEEHFVEYITSDVNHRLLNMTSWLVHEIHHFEHIKEKGVQVCISVSSERGVIQRQITRAEYVKHMIEYYLCMYFLPRFQETYYIGATCMPKCDLEATLTLFMQHDAIKKVIATTK